MGIRILILQAKKLRLREIKGYLRTVSQNVSKMKLVLPPKPELVTSTQYGLCIFLSAYQFFVKSTSPEGCMSGSSLQPQ